MRECPGGTAAIKPDYLKKLSECTERVEPLAAPGVMLAKCALTTPAYLADAVPRQP